MEMLPPQQTKLATDGMIPNFAFHALQITKCIHRRARIFRAKKHGGNDENKDYRYNEHFFISLHYNSHCPRPPLRGLADLPVPALAFLLELRYKSS
ncbi:hypothetical protein SDC9_102807 [bioreactor metagenome]|uniref:Uncharacterized protein n=1 Tax=bioreactor metagenome TaxID=1076179 RepID=A0A645ASF9_9ZZZZ